MLSVGRRGRWTAKTKRCLAKMYRYKIQQLLTKRMSSRRRRTILGTLRDEITAVTSRCFLEKTSYE